MTLWHKPIKYKEITTDIPDEYFERATDLSGELDSDKQHELFIILFVMVLKLYRRASYQPEDIKPYLYDKIVADEYDKHEYDVEEFERGEFPDTEINNQQDKGKYDYFNEIFDMAMCARESISASIIKEDSLKCVEYDIETGMFVFLKENRKVRIKLNYYMGDDTPVYFKFPIENNYSPDKLRRKIEGNPKFLLDLVMDKYAKKPAPHYHLLCHRAALFDTAFLGSGAAPRFNLSLLIRNQVTCQEFKRIRIVSYRKIHKVFADIDKITLEANKEKGYHFSYHMKIWGKGDEIETPMGHFQLNKEEPSVLEFYFDKFFLDKKTKTGDAGNTHL